MQKAKDYSYIKKGLYKIVYIEDENGQKVPFIFYSQNDVKMQYPKYIYKAINALGDSIYAKEYYNSIQQGGTTLKSSIINNGYDKITNEVEDVEIVNLFPQVEQIEKNKEIDNVSLTTENEFTPEQLGLNTNTTAEDFQC